MTYWCAACDCRMTKSDAYCPDCGRRNRHWEGSHYKPGDAPQMDEHGIPLSEQHANDMAVLRADTVGRAMRSRRDTMHGFPIHIHTKRRKQ